MNTQYDMNDGISKVADAEEDQIKLLKDIKACMDVVAPRVEEALQSNELINVFQDDFDCLGDVEEEGQSKQT